MTVSLLKSFLNSSVKCLNRVLSCNKIGTRRANFHTTRRNLKLKCTYGPVYTTRLALPPDYENVIDFMCEAYFKHEPSIVNIGLSEIEPPAYWQELLHDYLSEGLTIIAVDRDNCIVGVAQNTILLPSEADKMYDVAQCCDHPRLRKLLEFYAYVAEKSNLWERYCVSRVFQLNSIAVCSEFQRMGVARKLMEESWILARDCGYHLFTIECNSIYCAKISQGFGWQAIWSIPFRQYVRFGELVFRHIQEPHTMYQLFVDHLTYDKTYGLPYNKGKKLKSGPVPK